MTDDRKDLRAQLRAELDRFDPRRPVSRAATRLCEVLRDSGAADKLSKPAGMLFVDWQAQLGPQRLDVKARLVAFALQDSPRTLQIMPPEVTTAYNDWLAADQVAAKTDRDRKARQQTDTSDTPSGPRL